VILEPGALYVVATPIGNLGDMSQRAIEVLQNVELIAAEDTRHSKALLNHFQIQTRCIAVHEHNERKASPAILEKLQQGQNIALISDAGTPLLSDPGFFLVREAIYKGIKIIPIPGPSAVIAALSAAGLPTDRFHFEGFLPSKTHARTQKLESLITESATLIFYEAPHRIIDTLVDMQSVFGGQREIVLAREISKTFETFLRGSIDTVLGAASADKNQQKGEMVILLHGAEPKDKNELNDEAIRVLGILLKNHSVKEASALASEITGVKKNRLYDFAIKHREK